MDPLPIRNVKLFQGLSLDELRSLFQLGRDCYATHGDFFFHQDDPAGTLFVLIHGQVKMTQIGPDGDQVLIRVIRPRRRFWCRFSHNQHALPPDGRGG